VSVLRDQVGALREHGGETLARADARRGPPRRVGDGAADEQRDQQPCPRAARSARVRARAPAATPRAPDRIMQVSDLSLYQFDGCPYCQRVRQAMLRLGLDIELRDVHAEPRYRRELIEATGRGTVPCLRIEEGGGKVRWLHESLDIIAFLERHFPAAAPAAR
jgi:glutathione S-transferase